jgi:hypothetical protein
MIIACAGCKNGYTVANLEEKRKESKKIKTLLPPVLRSDEPALSTAIQGSGICGVAPLPSILLRDSPISQDATKFPAMRSFDSDLHESQNPNGRHTDDVTSNCGVQEKETFEEQDVDAALSVSVVFKTCC